MNTLIPHAGAEAADPRSVRMPTLSDRLQGEKERLEQRLREVNEAIAALDSSPEVKAAVDAIAKLGHF